MNQLNTCFCCSTISGDFLPSVSSGDGVPGISPGFGCENEKVSSIVKELRRRVRLRGDIAVKKRAEEQSRHIKLLSEQVSNLEMKLDTIISYFDIPQQQQQEVLPVPQKSHTQPTTESSLELVPISLQEPSLATIQRS